MKGFVFSTAAALASALVLTAWSGSSRADETIHDEKIPGSDAARLAPSMVISPPRGDTVTTERRAPNAALITTGAVMLGIPLTSSVIVAASSSRESDRYLYAPVVGPWMDLARRGNCVGVGCESEVGNKALLVADGLLQGIGALTLVSGFLFPTTRTVTHTASVHVAPTGLGMAAFGSF